MKRSRGLTLIEILVVLAIIGLVTAIALPMVAGTSNAEMRSAARQLASGLRLARSEAVSQRRETFLVIDLAGRRFKVDRDAREHPLPRRRTWSTRRSAPSASIPTAAATAAASRSAAAIASTRWTSTGSPAAWRSSTDG
jgi:type II secretion system protein H